MGLGATGSLLVQPLYSLWQNFVATFPGIVVALLLLVIGYLIGWTVGHVLKWLLERAKFDDVVRKSGLSKEFGHTHIPNLLGELVKWFVFIIFLQVAVDVLNLSALSMLLDDFVRWLPKVLVAIVIFFAGVALAHYIDYKITQNLSRKFS